MESMKNVMLMLKKNIKFMNWQRRESPGFAPGIHGIAAEKPGQLFFGLVEIIGCFGISLPSRAFSSQSLMDGEMVMGSQTFR